MQINANESSGNSGESFPGVLGKSQDFLETFRTGENRGVISFVTFLSTGLSY